MTSPALQPTPVSAKVIVPPSLFGDRRNGVVDVYSSGSNTLVATLNTPEVWWTQGDTRDAGSPGGWVRVMGRSLAFDDSSGECISQHTKVNLHAVPYTNHPLPPHSDTLQCGNKHSATCLPLLPLSFLFQEEAAVMMAALPPCQSKSSTPPAIS